MKLLAAVTFALIATAASAQPFPATTSTQSTAREPVKYHLFVTYFASNGVTTAIQLGPFLTEKACTNAASLVANKAAVGATACLKNQ